MDVSDLQTKYQKLATEYSKLRAQVPVLKKAVLEEQGIAQQLQDSIKERDLSLRKFEQEIESLTFRNKQLTSRVEILQKEQAGHGYKVKKLKGRSSPDGSNATSEGVGVLGEELQSKIEENVRLHKQVYEASEEHEEKVHGLEERLRVLESAASKHEDLLSATTSQSKALTDKLREDKALLEVRIQQQEKEVQELQARAQLAEELLQSLQSRLTQRLSHTSQILHDKILFNDTGVNGLNALNVPTADRQHQVKTKDLLGQGSLLVKQLVQALSNLHSYTEQRTAIYPIDIEEEPLSQVNTKFCALLHDHAGYLRPVEQAFRKFTENISEEALTTVETAVGLQDFASKLKTYTAFLNRLLPYHLLSIEEECSVSTCSPSLESRNWDVHCSLQKFIASFGKLQTYITLLAQQSDVQCDHLRGNQAQMFELLAKSASDFQDAVKDFSKHYNAKICLEHELPTASSKLKITDECLVSSLIALVTCTSKLSAFLSSNTVFFMESVGCKHNNSSTRDTDSINLGPRAHPAVDGFRRQAASYVTSLIQPCCDSVPYQVAVHNRRTLLSSTESRESLAQQVVSFQERVSELEQEREHWQLEAQLMHMKYEHHQQLHSQTSGMSVEQPTMQVSDHDDGMMIREGSMNGRSREWRANTNSNIPQDTSQLGQVLEYTCKDSLGSDEGAREHLIKTHLTERIAQLTLNLQNTDSRAIHFFAECRALHKRLSLAFRNKDTLSDEVSGAGHTITSLKDELQMITRSYEGQMSMMSEHLANMNEKLTTQKDEIEALKHQLLTNAKGGRKGRAK